MNLTDKAIAKLNELNIAEKDHEAVAMMVFQIKRTSNLRERGIYEANELAQDMQVSVQKVRSLILKYAENLRPILGGLVSYSGGYQSKSGNGPFAHYGQSDFARYSPSMLYFTSNGEK